MRSVCSPSVLRLLMPLLVSLPGAALPAQVLPSGWRTLPAYPPAPVTREFEAGTLPPGEFLRVRQSPVTPLAGSTIDTWLRATVATDSAPAGTWSGDLKVVPQTSTLVTATREFTTSANVTGAVLYTAMVLKGERARLLRTAFSSTPVIRGPEGANAKALMLELSRESPDVVHQPTADWPAAAPPVVAPPVPTAAPGVGVREADIETVYYHWDQRVDAFQGMVMDEEVYVLFRDGTVYDRLPESLAAFDRAGTQRTAPTHWGRWRRVGSAYEFSWTVGTPGWRRVRGNPVPASAPGTTVEGRFQSGSTYQQPGGNVGVTFLNEIVLTRDGHFTANGQDRGTYRIEPYAIELRHGDGRVERRSFLVDGDGIILQGGRMVRVKAGRS